MCTQKVGVLPCIIYCTKCMSQSIDLTTSLNEIVHVEIQEDSAPYPTCPSLNFLVNHEKLVLLEAIIERRVSR